MSHEPAIIRYVLPRQWIRYDVGQIAQVLVDAKAAVESLRTVPYRRDWVDKLQQVQLKREVAGTSRIEGAEFTERELDEALKESPEQLLTRSQRQAHAAVQVYRWIATLPTDRPLTGELIREIHHRMVTGADDDRCAPGVLRGPDQNVTFGIPRHRGCEGGAECEASFGQLIEAINGEFRGHDVLVQAIAAHYHFAAMHPFLDGNGRTARALEALVLGKAGLRDTCFIAMSNYYHDEKAAYLTALSETRRFEHDLTPFLLFALKGVALQSRRLLAEIQRGVKREMFSNMMLTLFKRLETKRRRVISERKVAVLQFLLDQDASGKEWTRNGDLVGETKQHYANLRNPLRALFRDLSGLRHLQAIKLDLRGEDGMWWAVNLEWPTQITETEFFRRIRELPRAKTHDFLR
jgi:Fic family protein